MPEPERDLFHLVEAGDQESLRSALETGADPRSANAWGETLLTRAASEGQLAMVRCLLEKGVPVDHASGAGNTPLMAAAARGHLEVVACLLQTGADPAHGNKWGFSALDWASWPDNAAEITGRLRETSV